MLKNSEKLIKKNNKNKKNTILKSLKNTYCRLEPSKINGVGIFAIRNIPKDTDPFLGIKKQGWHKINMFDLKNLDNEIIKMIDDFFVIEKDDTVLIPDYGLNGMDISFFLNHSEKPNLKTDDEGFNFLAIRKINKGEELTVDYGTYDHKYKKRS